MSETRNKPGKDSHRKVSGSSVVSSKEPKKEQIKTFGTSRKLDRYLVGLIILMFGLTLIRLHLLDCPIENDEGEYAYMGKLILQGLTPYKDAYNMKLPGTYAMYALIMGIFGQTVTGIHLGYLFLNIGSIVFFYLAFRSLFNSSIALFAVAVFGISSVSPFVLGLAAHATHFVNFFVAIGFYFISRYYKNRTFLNSFLTGLMFGLAFLMKQQAVFFILFGGTAILFITLKEKPANLAKGLLQSVMYAAGVILPYLLVLVWIYSIGAFPNFWFWTVKYASEYTGALPMELGLRFLKENFYIIFLEFWPFWVLAFAGIIISFFMKMEKSKKIIAFLFFVFAALSVCPGFYFRSHYFVTALPAMGLLAGISINYITDYLKQRLNLDVIRYLPLLVFLFPVLYILNADRFYYIDGDEDSIVKSLYQGRCFSESRAIGEYIKENSKPSDKLAIFGSEPQIFFYADRLSATGHIYTYGMMEPQPYNLKMQKEMCTEVGKASPKFLIFSSMKASWIKLPDSPTYIFDWYNQFAQKYYDIVCVVDYTDKFFPKFFWNDHVREFQMNGQEYILIARRRT
jgi:hypothetical protein